MAGLDPDLAAKCHRNYVEALWQYVRRVRGAARIDRKGATLLRSELPISLTNVAFIVDGDARHIPAAKEFFGPKRPWRVLAAGPSARPLEGPARSLGLREVENEPGLMLKQLPSAPSPPAGLSVRAVESEVEFRAFGEAWCRAFRIPRWSFPLVFPSPLPPEDPIWHVQNRWFLGLVQDRPVAVAVACVTDGIVGVYSVGTVAHARGRGYGTALTWAAIDAGRSLGARTAFLAATPMGYPVYHRMGFRDFEPYPAWEHRWGVARTLIGLWRFRRAVLRG